jgi:hypothetical protein
VAVAMNVLFVRTRCSSAVRHLSPRSDLVVAGLPDSRDRLDLASFYTSNEVGEIDSSSGGAARGHLNYSVGLSLELPRIA